MEKEPSAFGFPNSRGSQKKNLSNCRSQSGTLTSALILYKKSKNVKHYPIILIHKFKNILYIDFIINRMVYVVYAYRRISSLR